VGGCGSGGQGTFMINLFTSNVIIVRTPVGLHRTPNDPQRVHPNHHVICTHPPLFQRHPPSSQVSHAFHLVLVLGPLRATLRGLLT
jgi:hypothetical protein